MEESRTNSSDLVDPDEFFISSLKGIKSIDNPIFTLLYICFTSVFIQDVLDNSITNSRGNRCSLERKA